jgi:hypothetical protein
VKNNGEKRIMTRSEHEDERDAKKCSSCFVTVNEGIEIPNHFTRQRNRNIQPGRG